MTINELYDKLKKDYGECKNCEIIGFPNLSPELCEGFVVKCNYTNSTIDSKDYCTDCPRKEIR